MSILDDLLGSLPTARIASVLMGLHWTAVVADSGGVTRCGLASTMRRPHTHHGDVDVPQAGQLEKQSGTELASLAQSDQITLAAVGLAAINATLPH